MSAAKSPRRKRNTRPGDLDPHFLTLLPAVAAALRKTSSPVGVTAAGWSIAADVLDAVAEWRDPRELFDLGKSTKARDWTAKKVLARFESGESIRDAIRAVAAETSRDEKTVARHLRAYGRNLWPGGVTWVRSDGSRDAD